MCACRPFSLDPEAGIGCLRRALLLVACTCKVPSMRCLSACPSVSATFALPVFVVSWATWGLLISFVCAAFALAWLVVSCAATWGVWEPVPSQPMHEQHLVETSYFVWPAGQYVSTSVESSCQHSLWRLHHTPLTCLNSRHSDISGGKWHCRNWSLQKQGSRSSNAKGRSQ